ncbi:DUF1289 domain-containing protein [Massilia sp. W12]|uniref:DUF1289 domain-containing protein n=1 Tax=Massilia sp. W12 TaxID=3126507 RepID=UPI0030CD3BDC
MTRHIRNFNLEQHQGLLPSPCINVCKMDAERGVCLGCLRNIDEIIAWSRADETYKRQVWQALKQRAQK